MKKTLTKKKINGHDYYYLSYRKGDKVVSQYLGTSSSTKYKKYLYALTNQASRYGLEKVKQYNFKNGIPVAYVEDGYLVYEYSNGTQEFLNSKMQVVKVLKRGRKRKQ